MSAENLNQSNVQLRFLELLKNKIPSHLSLADEICKSIDVSLAGAYRRIKGEKELTINEVYKLAVDYGVSLELLTPQISNDLVWFSFRTLDNKSFTFEQYLQSQIDHLEVISASKSREMIYSAKDLPVFHYYHFDELASFKIFVWKRSIMGLEEYQNRKFVLRSDDEEENVIKGKMALERYLKVPSCEIWNDETPHSAIRQIQLYQEMGIFENKKDAFILIEQFEDMISHLKAQAESGKKFRWGESAKENDAEYKLFNNEVVLCDNSIFAQVEDRKMIFLTHNTLNYMYITNREYCENAHKWLKNLMSRSTLISSASEKERERFFKSIREKVDSVKKKIKY